MAGIIPGMSNQKVLVTFAIALLAIWAVERDLFGIAKIVKA